MLNLELTDSARLAGRWATGVCLSLLLSTGISDSHPHTLIFIWILDYLNSGIMWQALYQLNHLPSPSLAFHLWFNEAWDILAVSDIRELSCQYSRCKVKLGFLG